MSIISDGRDGDADTRPAPAHATMPAGPKVSGCGGSGHGAEKSQVLFGEAQRSGGYVLGEVREAAGSGNR